MQAEAEIRTVQESSLFDEDALCSEREEDENFVRDCLKASGGVFSD